jgi:hypothetical protein
MVFFGFGVGVGIVRVIERKRALLGSLSVRACELVLLVALLAKPVFSLSKPLDLVTLLLVSVCSVLLVSLSQDTRYFARICAHTQVS